MGRKRLVSRVELGLVEMRLKDARLEVVDLDLGGNAAEGLERVLVAADECLQVLAVHQFLVAVAAVRQRHLEKPGAPRLAPVKHHRTDRVVHLGLLPWRTRQA